MPSKSATIIFTVITLASFNFSSPILLSSKRMPRVSKSVETSGKQTSFFETRKEKENVTLSWNELIFNHRSEKVSKSVSAKRKCSKKKKKRKKTIRTSARMSKTFRVTCVTFRFDIVNGTRSHELWTFFRGILCFPASTQQIESTNISYLRRKQKKRKIRTLRERVDETVDYLLAFPFPSSPTPRRVLRGHIRVRVTVFVRV